MDELEKESEWWWIDYLEDEFPKELEEDLERLLQNSAEDRDRFEKFRLLKQWVKGSDLVTEVESELEKRLPALRQKIMAEVTKAEVEARSEAELEWVQRTNSLRT